MTFIFWHIWHFVQVILIKLSWARKLKKVLWYAAPCISCLGNIFWLILRYVPLVLMIFSILFHKISHRCSCVYSANKKVKKIWCTILSLETFWSFFWSHFLYIFRNTKYFPYNLRKISWNYSDCNWLTVTRLRFLNVVF